MSLSKGQKKALVTALVFGAKEVHSKAWQALVTKNFAAGGNIGGGLTREGLDLALSIIQHSGGYNIALRGSALQRGKYENRRRT